MKRHSPPTLAAERRAAVAEAVRQGGTVRVVELAARFGVNAATIRRDLGTLEEQGEIRRVHGGAVALEKTAGEGQALTTQESRIGQALAGMVGDGETIFLGPGQLPLAAARSLAGHARLTIVTNGIEIAHWVALNTAHTLIVTGGQAEGRDVGLVGQLAQSALAGLRANHVVLQLDGVSAVGGLTGDSLPQAEMAQLVLEIGSQIIALVRPERVGQAAAVYVAPASDADIIITAREAPSSALWDLSEAGVRVVLA